MYCVGHSSNIGGLKSLTFCIASGWASAADDILSILLSTTPWLVQVQVKSSK